MAIALFPASFAPGGAGVLAACVAHTTGLAVALQTQLSSAGRAACPTLLDRLVTGGDLLGRGCIRRHVTLRRRRRVQSTDGARRAKRIDAQASGGRLTRCFANLAASAKAEIVRAAGFAARRVRACGRPVALVHHARRTKGSTRAPSGSCVAHRSQAIVAHAARYERYGRYGRDDHKQKSSTKQVSHKSTYDENSATSRTWSQSPRQQRTPPRVVPLLRTRRASCVLSA
jgi:hypothetical protein